ncbi:MAG: hypothetical protein ACAH95_05390 [Fimbriimonas sp.]
MLLALTFAVAQFSFHALDFLPTDINDKGWIVGVRVRHTELGKTYTPVLRMPNRQIDLTSFPGSAVGINNRGEVLIVSEQADLPKGLGGKEGTACLLWANGKTTYLGNFKPNGRFSDNGGFLARRDQTALVVRVIRGSAVVSKAPAVPPLQGYPSSDVYWYDMNEHGSLVGVCDLGTSWSHAILMDSRRRITDLHPQVEMHTGWSAEFINSKGHVMGYHSFDSSIGGGGVFLWKGGKTSLLPATRNMAILFHPSSFNDQDQATGNLGLYDSGSFVGELVNKELRFPPIATATTHGMFWDTKQFWNLNEISDKPLNCIIATTMKISNKGWIIGSAVQDEKRIGYFLVPK